MAQFIVESKHTAEECLAALDEVMAYDLKLLDQFLWGCKSGDHTGWAMFEGENEEDIKNKLPEKMKREARIIEVVHFTKDQLEAAHK